MLKEFEFIPPEEAKTFFPTEEEFSSPLDYIRKIQPIAKNYGICKIKPPESWSPPFSADIHKFKFTPRIQKINELEALTRIKINFMDQLSKFWEVQGTILEIPTLDGKSVDLYALHQIVHSAEFKRSRGDNERKWDGAINRLHLMSNTLAKKDIILQLRTIYETILKPYDTWKSINNLKVNVIQLKRKRQGSRPRQVSRKRRFDDGQALKQTGCAVCSKLYSNEGNKRLKCDCCGQNYHTSCLKQSPTTINATGWVCTMCVTAKMQEDDGEFGFDEAATEYTLQEFKEKADAFKANYFKNQNQEVSLKEMEREFWRIVSAGEENVTVEYGADVLGTGFPLVSSGSSSEYAESKWNLNNLPVVKGSAFAHINSEVSGMKSPWVYVGMCFSTFCWHNEDHWSYSISYHHTGDPKTWYGVPGAKAVEFETAMKSAAPELFQKAPDLLHRLVTLINPNVLMECNVPVFRLDQKPGEFIVTFPRSYHAGFNQGFNFAEAVNFGPADWISVGRECVLSYSAINRIHVFSHDELILGMAKEPEKLGYYLSYATYKDLLGMLEAETKLRKAAQAKGVKDTIRVEFENIPDDQRQCAICKATLFLSAVTCKHFKGTATETGKMVCLRHFDRYNCKDCKIDPTKYTMMFRYTLVEMSNILKNWKCALERSALKMKCIALLKNPCKPAISDVDKLLEEVCRLNNERLPCSNSIQSKSASTEQTVHLRIRNNTISDTKFKFNQADHRIADMSHPDVDITEREIEEFSFSSPKMEDLRRAHQRDTDCNKMRSNIRIPPEEYCVRIKFNPQ